MSGAEIWSKIRPTALTFAGLLTALIIILIVLGVPEAVKSGSESAVNMIYLIIGTGLGGLIGPLTKLCEDAPPPPPPMVPETTVMHLFSVLGLEVEGGEGALVVGESHTRPREGIGDDG